MFFLGGGDKRENHGDHVFGGVCVWRGGSCDRASDGLTRLVTSLLLSPAARPAEDGKRCLDGKVFCFFLDRRCDTEQIDLPQGVGVVHCGYSAE